MGTLHSSLLMLTRLLLLVGLVFVVPACSQKDGVEPAPQSAATADAKDQTKTFYGPAVPLGQGVGRAWVIVNDANVPISIGVELSAKAILNMGTVPAEYTFQLPRQVAVPPYDHIEFEWNPQGHEPAMYMVPHFDMHFYMITSAYQATIPFLAPPAFDPAPASRYMPTGYVQGPGLVPDMGAHWLDVFSPELHGAPFTKTFIYGTYQAHVTFLEPMFALSYLQTQPNQTMVLRQPDAYERAGYYPTSYTIRYDTSPNQYIVSLNGLQYHPAM